MTASSENRILGMIFYYYLSDRTEKYMANLLKDDGINYEEAWADEEYKSAVIEEALRDLGYSLIHLLNSLIHILVVAELAEDQALEFVCFLRYIIFVRFNPERYILGI